jgi:hypothetical protein
MRYPYFALLGAIGFLFHPPAARAVVTASNSSSTSDNNTTAPAGLDGWNYVGQIGGASGIYLGNGWVLTADHVGAGNINLNGTTYNWNGKPEIRLNNNNNSADPTDLVMFQLTSQPAGLSPLTLANTSPSGGDSFTNVGYGVARNTALEYFAYDSTTQTYSLISGPAGSSASGFGVGSINTKSWGTNQVQGFSSFNIGWGNVHTFYGEFFGFTDQLINGDSGGAVFDSAGNLIGVNDAIGTFPNQPASTVFFDDVSYMIDLAPFHDQIQSIVPEPSGLSLLALAGVAALRRRRRAGK